MAKPLISVIVPAYQAEQWLEECCRSVFSQTYSNWELIVVNDGSQDRTGKIADLLADENGKVRVIHTENGGVCRARNIGLDTAKGEYITFLDADDLLMPDALEYLFILLNDENADISIGQKIVFGQDGKETPGNYPDEYAVWQGKDALIHSLKDHPATYSVWGKLYKRQLVEDVRFVLGKHIHEDSFFLFQCVMKQPKVVASNRIILRYRLSENSASRSPFSEKMFDILYFAEEKEKLIRNYYPELLLLVNNLKIKANMALLRNLCKTTEKKYRRVEKKCIQDILKHKRHFIPATEADRKWFWIITHHMYDLYKRAYLLKEK